MFAAAVAAAPAPATAAPFLAAVVVAEARTAFRPALVADRVVAREVSAAAALSTLSPPRRPPLRMPPRVVRGLAAMMSVSHRQSTCWTGWVVFEGGRRAGTIQRLVEIAGHRWMAGRWGDGGDGRRWMAEGQDSQSLSRGV